MLTVFSGIAGGLAVFLFGLQTTSDSLQKVAGGALRGVLSLAAGTPLKGVLTGLFITLCTQSSSATTVLLIGFVRAGLMQFAKTVGVILGADLGTTVTVQLIAFRLEDYALLIVAAGFIASAVCRYERERYMGRALLGFGLIFTGMALMGEGVRPLQDNEGFLGLLVMLKDRPLVSLMAATLITAVIQGSAATIAFAITLASQGLFGEDPARITLMALPIIFGANIGTCGTAFLASMKAPGGAARIATAHLLIKVMGVVIFLPFMRQFAAASAGLSGSLPGADVSPARLLANAHTLFNLLIVFILLPFTSSIAKLSGRVQRAGRAGEASANYSLLETPEIALSWAGEKISEMFSALGEMFSGAMEILKTGDRRGMERTRNMDSLIDSLNKEVVVFLGRLGQKSLSREQSEREIRLINISSRVENAADIISREILFFTEKIILKGLSFSFEGFHEIRAAHAMVSDSLEDVAAAFRGEAGQVQEKLRERNEKLKEYSARSCRMHIMRLHKGISESYSTEEVHFHLLASFNSINLILLEIAENLNPPGE